MAEYIDRNAFIQRYRELYCTDCDSRKGMKNGKLKFCYEIGGTPCRACRQNDVLDDLEDYPAADVVEVRHGHWGTDKHGLERSICSECGAVYEGGPYNFCPNCGAKMDGEEAE